MEIKSCNCFLCSGVKFCNTAFISSGTGVGFFCSSPLTYLPKIVSATDTFNATTNKTIYIRVTPNVAPVFRETSTGGSIITSFSTTRNENASSGELTKIYFTDAESDTITIQSSSIPGDHFSITKYATYVSVAQATSSLDYETTSSYSFSITASDEHFQAGQDTDSVTTLPNPARSV